MATKHVRFCTYTYPDGAVCGRGYRNRHRSHDNQRLTYCTNHILTYLHLFILRHKGAHKP